MLSEKLRDELNKQLNREIYSAYLYMAMAAYCDAQSLQGFAAWLQAQAAEELGHAMKFYNYMSDRGAKVELEAVPKPPTEYESPLRVFEETLKHERFITDSINKLYDLALKENDYATQTFLHWFITEQVEEEKSVGQILDTLKLIGDKGQALIMLDRELGRRGQTQQQ
ncbi:MAG TPA: ferritin [Bacteroidetes bacterium]|nr:ferritin [Bacteroidota bacterium]